MNTNIVRTLILAAITFAGAASMYHRFDGTEETALLQEGASGKSLILEATTDLPVVRSVAKRRLAEDLIARRRTLWEVAALFREINNYPQYKPACQLPVLAPHPMTFLPRTEEERVVIQVVQYVSNMLYRDEPRCQEEILRLEKILLDQLERHGVVLLPDPASLIVPEELLREARLMIRHQ